MQARIFFAKSKFPRLNVLRAVNLCRRRPYKSLQFFLCWLITKLTRSDIAHVSIGFDGAVLEVGFNNNRYWPVIAYALQYPRLVGCYDVPVHQDIDLDRYQSETRKPVMPTLFKWLTFGLIRTEDCVCTVKDALDQGGVHVPRSVTNPIQLYRWLEAQNYEYTDFTDDEPPEHRRD